MIKQVFAELRAKELFLLGKPIHISALRVNWARKTNSFVSCVEDGVVAVEKVKAQNPMTHIWSIHQAQLALSCGVLHVSGARKLVGHIVNSKRDVLEHVVVISRAHRRRKSVFKLIEVQIGVSFLYYSHKLFEIFCGNEGQRCSCVYNELINIYLEWNSSILHITHRQSPVVGVEKVVPE